MRIITAILACIYLLMITGFTVHKHYCMGELVKTSVIEKNESVCSTCGMKNAHSGNGCCRDEHNTIKSDDKHIQGKTAGVIAYKIFEFTPSYLPEYSWSVHVIEYSKFTALAHAPPGYWRSCPIYKQVGNFRI